MLGAAFLYFEALNRHDIFVFWFLANRLKKPNSLNKNQWQTKSVSSVTSWTSQVWQPVAKIIFINVNQKAVKQEKN